MNQGFSFDRIDIVKLIVLGILLTALLSSGIYSLITVEPAESFGIQAATETADIFTWLGETATQAAQARRTPQVTTETEVDLSQLPEFPQSVWELFFEPDNQSLKTPDGIQVYILDNDQGLWVPVVPDELEQALENPEPILDENGRWVIISLERNQGYRWEANTLTWYEVSIDSISPPIAEALPTTETPAEPTQAAPTATPAPPVAQATEEPQSPETVYREVPTPTPGIPGSYTLQTNEFVYCIARRFNVNPYEILSLNGLTTSSIVRKGMTLKIPQTGNPFPGNRSLRPHPTTHVVERGENIYSIACDYGSVDPWAIAYANELSPPYNLTAGQKLYIP